MLFEGSIQHAEMVKSVLNKYERSTQQLVCLEKCSILYGKNCSDDNKYAIKSLLGYETVSFEDNKYLELPMPEGGLDENGNFQ